MYKLQSSTDISFLLDATVSQIVVALSALHIDFEAHKRLSILSSFAVTKPGTQTTTFDGSADDAVVLFDLISDAVIKAGATDSGGLRLEFKSGIQLEVFDDSDQFESFCIVDGDRMIVV